MIETTPRQLLTLVQNGRSNPLSKLGDVVTPADAMWEIQEVVEVVDKTLEHYNVHRLKLLEKFGTLEEGGQEYRFETPADRFAFEEEHNRLLDYELNLQIKPLKKRHIEAAKLSARDVTMARFLFDLEAVEVVDPFEGFEE